MKKILLVILVLIILGGVFYVYRQKISNNSFEQNITPSSEILKGTQLESQNTESQNTTQLNLSQTISSEDTTQQVKEVVIKITANGFVPKEIEISGGTKVTWVNESSNPSWPASAVHPTHEVYPGSSIKKCGTPEQDKIFDSCRGLKKGESWNFVFNEVGEWYYHDHLNPSWTGKIVVK